MKKGPIIMNLSTAARLLDMGLLARSKRKIVVNSEDLDKVMELAAKVNSPGARISTDGHDVTVEHAGGVDTYQVFWRGHKQLLASECPAYKKILDKQDFTANLGRLSDLNPEESMILPLDFGEFEEPQF
jgi:hypothetical protein